MSTSYISEKLRRRVAANAQYRYGYCLKQEIITGTPMEIDHIIPEALGGSSDEDNLWLACSQCNGFKSDTIVLSDELTGENVALFNPRHQQWSEHFRWIKEGLYVEGITATGRVTVKKLQMNNLLVVRARAIWIAAGWHPPT